MKKYLLLLCFTLLLAACTASNEPIVVTEERQTAVPPPPTVTPEPTIEVEAANEQDAFITELQTAVVNQDFAALQTMMRDPIGAGPWRSEWQSLTPEQMITQLQNGSLPGPSAVQFSNLSLPEISELLGGQPVAEMLGPDANVAAVLHSSGWGPGATDDALLFVTESDGRYAWSAFLYTNGRFADANLDPISAPIGANYIVWGEGIYQIQADGTHRQIATADTANIPNLRLSPDGRYTAYFNDDRQLWLLNNRNGQEQQLAAEHNLSGYLMWGNNNTLFTGVWLSADEADGPNIGHLATLDIDSGSLQILDETRLSANKPALAADGQTIAFDVIPSRPDDQNTSRLYHPDSGVTIFDPSAFTAQNELIDQFRYNPSWSPNGRQLTWFSSTGERVGLQLYDLDAQTAVQLFDWDPARFGGNVPSPIWSPDGQWLALDILANGPAGSGIWLFAVDGSHQLQIDAQGHEPHWVNNTQLIYGVNDGVRLYDLTEEKTFKPDLPQGSWILSVSSSPATSIKQTPNLDYVNNENGCGDIFVYKPDANQSEYITTWVNASALDLSSEPTTFDLGTYLEVIHVTIDMYGDTVTNLGEFPYCNDVAPIAEPQAIWNAISGTVTISVSAVPGQPCTSEPYQTTISLADVTFILNDETVYLPSLTYEDVTVGWCAG